MNKTKIRHTIFNISSCAIFVALNFILSRLAIYIPLFGSNSFRLSLTAVPIIISSFILGPIYGGIVGGLGDLIGALLFPAGPYFFGFTFDSILLGVFPGLIFLLNKKKKSISTIIVALLSFLIIAVIISYVIINDTLTVSKQTIDLKLWLKILLPIIYIFLFSLSLFIPLLIKKGGDNIMVVTASLLANEFIVSGLIASAWKNMLYGIDYFVGFATNMFLLLINLPIKVIIISCLYPVIKEVFSKTSKSYFIDESFPIDIEH